MSKLNQLGVTNSIIHFVSGVLGPCNKQHNTTHMTDSVLDWETVVNDDLNELLKKEI